jgi:hypothetical protein
MKFWIILIGGPLSILCALNPTPIPMDVLQLGGPTWYLYATYNRNTLYSDAIIEQPFSLIALSTFARPNDVDVKVYYFQKNGSFANDIFETTWHVTLEEELLWIHWDIIAPSNLTRLKHANVSCIYYEAVGEDHILGIGSLSSEFALIFTSNTSRNISSQKVIKILVDQTYKATSLNVAFMNYHPTEEIEKALLQIEKERIIKQETK